MYCVKCGNKLTEEDMFCPKCGAKCMNEVATSAMKSEPSVGKGKDWLSRGMVALSCLLIVGGIFLPFLVIGFLGFYERASIVTFIVDWLEESNERLIVGIIVAIMAIPIVNEILQALCGCKLKASSIISGIFLAIVDCGLYIYIAVFLMDIGLSGLGRPGIGFFMILAGAIMMIVFGCRTAKKEGV